MITLDKKNTLSRYHGIAITGLTFYFLISGLGMSIFNHFHNRVVTVRTFSHRLIDRLLSHRYHRGGGVVRVFPRFLAFLGF